jgi:hypothetical protein
MMSEQLAAAIEALISTYQDPVLIARGLVIDPQEVALELAQAIPDSSEGAALRILAKTYENTQHERFIELPGEPS